MLKESKTEIAVAADEKPEAESFAYEAPKFAYEANPLALNGQKGNKIYFAYGYNWEDRKFCGKIGQTSKQFAEERVKRISGAARGDLELIAVWDAVRNDGTPLTDHDVHKALERAGWPIVLEGENPLTGEMRPLNGDRKRGKTEWVNFKDAVCNLDRNEIPRKIYSIVNDVIEKLKNNCDVLDRVPLVLIPHQTEITDKMVNRFLWYETNRPSATPKLLLDAVMRSGKTVMFLYTALKLGCRTILMSTHIPSVRKSVEDDIARFTDFENIVFAANPKNPSDPSISEQIAAVEEDKIVVCFASFQDILGTDLNGNIKEKNRGIHGIVWDIMGIDECHFGAGTLKSRNVVEATSRKALQQNEIEDSIVIRPQDMPIRAKRYVYMSGTPFDAVHSGEFEEEDIFRWTYKMEQQAKRDDFGGKGFYENVVEMRTFVPELPDELKKLMIKNGGCSFDLDAFFAAKGRGKNAKFFNEISVTRFFDYLFGYFGDDKDLLYSVKNQGIGKMQLFNRTDIDICRHSILFFGTVASCDAAFNILKKNAARWKIGKYQIINCSGPKAGIGPDALPPIEMAIGRHPFETNSITITCGKGMTGTTIPGWDTIFMLLNLHSTATLLQSEMRTRSTYVEKDEDGNVVYRKKYGWVIDFDQNRVLRTLSEISYAECADDSERNMTPQERIIDYSNFWHLYAMDGCQIKELSYERRYDLITEMLESSTQLERFFNSGFANDFGCWYWDKFLNDQQLVDVLMIAQKIRCSAQDKALQNIVITSNPQITHAKRLVSDTENDSKNKGAQDLRRMMAEAVNSICSRIRTLLYVQPVSGSIANVDDILKIEDSELFMAAIGITQKEFARLLSYGAINRIKMNEGIQRFNWYLEKVSKKAFGSESVAA